VVGGRVYLVYTLVPSRFWVFLLTLVALPQMHTTSLYFSTLVCGKSAELWTNTEKTPVPNVDCTLKLAQVKLLLEQEVTVGLGLTACTTSCVPAAGVVRLLVVSHLLLTW